ncbi:MAG: glycerate kinase, partial [Bacteroidetes bacterium]|nr:glycerate kinase [Bacteroidota bacterium]
MKVIIAPDKFKGSLSSFGVCEAIAAGIRQRWPDAEILFFPMADGGDGFAAVMKHYLHTSTIACSSADPLGRTIQVSYEWSAADRTAIIEMAAASGIVLLKPYERNPLRTSTYGTGLLMNDAMQRGAKKILLGLGGSATNDGGLGILAALGYEVKYTEGNDAVTAADGAKVTADSAAKNIAAIDAPNGESLQYVRSIVPPSSAGSFPSLLIACDVQNPLYGPQGAAYIYAPQKGANPAQVEELDRGLRNYAAVIQKQTG